MITTREEIFDELSDRGLLSDEEHIILVDGFESAFIGVTASKPIKAIYNYWKCLDYLVAQEKMDFDLAIDNLNEFIEQDLGETSPLYIKEI